MTARLSPAEWAWQRQSVWSQTADRLKAGPARARRWALALTVLAAATGLASSQLKETTLAMSVSLAVVAALAGSAVAMLRGGYTQTAVERWTRSRSIAEQLKTMVLLHLARVAESEDPDASLEASARRLETEADDSLLAEARRHPPTMRELPDVRDLESYLDVRVRPQITYYENGARSSRQGLRVVRAIEVTLALMAAGLGALAAWAPTVGAWAAVVTTTGAAVTAHAASERYGFLSVEYARTADQLRYLMDRRVDSDGSPLSDAQLVRICEQVITTQNLGWMAKWGSTAGS